MLTPLNRAQLAAVFQQDRCQEIVRILDQHNIPSQVRTMDRSERIRTYNFPENRIADHRTGYKAYNLDAVLNGDLEAVVQSAIEMDEAARLEKLGQEDK